MYKHLIILSALWLQGCADQFRCDEITLNANTRTLPGCSEEIVRDLDAYSIELENLLAAGGIGAARRSILRDREYFEKSADRILECTILQGNGEEPKISLAEKMYVVQSFMRITNDGPFLADECETKLLQDMIAKLRISET